MAIFFKIFQRSLSVKAAHLANTYPPGNLLRYNLVVATKNPILMIKRIAGPCIPVKR